tara:strand:- start:1416 stop:1667 length:252 start_codon:yes stop_codon:yes gene_type:complete
VGHAAITLKRSPPQKSFPWHLLAHQVFAFLNTIDFMHLKTIDKNRACIRNRISKHPKASTSVRKTPVIIKIDLPPKSSINYIL